MRTIFWVRDSYNEYHDAMRRVSTGMRRGDLREVKEWLSVAERCLRMQSRLDEIGVAHDKRNAWGREQPHRLRALEKRGNAPR